MRFLATSIRKMQPAAAGNIRALALLLAVSVLPITAGAQRITGTLRGLVTDPGAQ